MDERIRNLPTYPMIELARRKREMEAQGVHVIDFGTGDPLEATDPRIRQALIDAVPEVSQYPSVAGTPELRQAYVAWYARRFGVALDPETEVLPSRGSKEAIFHLPLVEVDRESDRRLVIYPEPGYPVMEIGSLYAVAEPCPIQLTRANDYLMDPDDVDPELLKRAAIVWLNYPHNPTGQDLPSELWKAWVAAREEHGFLLCSDECYTELYFGERPHSLLEFGREGCLVFHSLSKRSGLTGYRSGMMAGDAQVLGRYRRHRAAFGQANSVFVDAAGACAWADEGHVEQRREAFAAKRDLMITGLSAKGLDVYPTTSTFYLWVEVPAGKTDLAYADALLAAGILVSPGRFFGRGNEGFFRVALVPKLAGCEAALTRWPAV